MPLVCKGVATTLQECCIFQRQEGVGGIFDVPVHRKVH